jgi:thiamine-phosphate pyrophosphorylase
LVGVEALRQVRPHAAGPLVAIGGITAARVPEVRAAGADGVAVTSAVRAAADPGAAAATFLTALPGFPGDPRAEMKPGRPRP